MADQQIINYGAAPNDGLGDPLRDAFIKVDENFANLWAAGPVNTNVTIANNSVTVTNTNGNLILNPNGIGVIQTNNHVVPRINGVYNLGSPALAYKTAYIGTGGVTTTGNVTADYFLGDGSQLTNLPAGNYSNANVASFLATFGANTIGSTGNITTTANISGGYILGNGSQLTGIAASYGNANVVANLAALGSNPISTTGNITAGYFVGDGSRLTNVTVSTGTAIVNGNSNVSVAANANVTVGVSGVANVATFTTTGLAVTGNVSGNYVLGDGSQLAKTMTDRGSDPSNWDTTTQMGIYKVNRESWSGVTGAPIDSSVYVGILQVNTSGDATTQIFYPGTVSPPTDVRIQWNRSLWNSAWTAWIRIVNNGQTIDAGTY